MAKFEVISEYSPSGDQPKAIEILSKSIEEGNQYNTLLGVTGSGKTFTVAAFCGAGPEGPAPSG